MAEFEMPGKLIQMTKACMEDGKPRVRINSKLSDSFKIRSGLKQGDALSPLLFKIALEKAEKKSAEIQTELLTARDPKRLLAYADDIDIIRYSTPTVKGIFH